MPLGVQDTLLELVVGGGERDEPSARVVGAPVPRSVYAELLRALEQHFAGWKAFFAWRNSSAEES